MPVRKTITAAPSTTETQGMEGVRAITGRRRYVQEAKRRPEVKATKPVDPVVKVVIKLDAETLANDPVLARRVRRAARTNTPRAWGRISRVLAR